MLLMDVLVLLCSELSASESATVTFEILYAQAENLQTI